MCVKFDESSDKFIKDCEFSTMCVKRISTLTLGNGQVIETMTRGCASQKYTDQVGIYGFFFKLGSLVNCAKISS